MQLQSASLGQVVPSARDGKYIAHAFLGYSIVKGAGKYIPMVPYLIGFDMHKVCTDCDQFLCCSLLSVFGNYEMRFRGDLPKVL